MWRVLIAGLALALGGCSEESMRSMSDKEDIMLSEKLIRDIQTGDQINALKVIDIEVKADFKNSIENFRSLLPQDPKAKLSLTGVRIKKAADVGSKSVDAAQLTYMVGTEKDDAVVRIEIHKTGQIRQVVAFEINPTDEET
jgi:hypothetical protein